MIRFATWVLGCLSALFLVLAGSAAQAGYVFNELNSQQQAEILRGNMVSWTVDVPGAAIPRIIIYYPVPATAEQVAAVNADYELRSSYTPGLLQSKVTKIISKTVVQADYRVKVPVVSDENFTLEHAISRLPQDETYRTEWKLIRADRTRRSDGYAVYEPLGSGALMKVDSFVDPGSFGGMIKDRVIRETREQAVNFSRWVENERTNKAQLLEQQIQRLRDAFANY